MKTAVIYPTYTEAHCFIDAYGEEYKTFICGMGKESERGVELILADYKPDLAVMAGTAGAYFSSGLRLFDTVAVEREYLGCERYDSGNLPLWCKTVFSNTVLSPTAATDDSNADIENMEGAYFFKVCRDMGVRCYQLRTISNMAGAQRGEWHIEEASEVLSEDLYKFMKKIEDEA